MAMHILGLMVCVWAKTVHDKNNIFWGKAKTILMDMWPYMDKIIHPSYVHLALIVML